MLAILGFRTGGHGAMASVDGSRIPDWRPE